MNDTQATAGGAPRAASGEERYWRNALNAVFAVTVLRPRLARARPRRSLSRRGAVLVVVAPSGLRLLLEAAGGRLAHRADDHACSATAKWRCGLPAPLLHFATALAVFALAQRLYDARVAAWSAVVYATLPGVSASAVIMSTDAPLLLCWAVALLCLRARARRGRALVAGASASPRGLGLLSKYAMAYWLVSALLYLLAYRDERRHLPRVSRRDARSAFSSMRRISPGTSRTASPAIITPTDNAAFHGLLFHPGHFLLFFGSQFGVFGPLLFAALIVLRRWAARLRRPARGVPRLLRVADAWP